ncbi:branched-chain amino acid ABC transporter permease [Nitratidesulfovibrio termitidis]|uniref:branched-chain amino acid ABC transporter permease n=1 Tax=Nitratidesulfovibrio termitidis TaxID=42252 RepID=UPI0003F56338|nr:branched-chain amino acid ABC transporter permease [Nitratidesulfovibrio termitidis]
MTQQEFKRNCLIAVTLAAFALPLVVRSATYLHILIILYLYAYMTTTWNLVGGFAGVLPLGHSVFVGIGAYTSTILWLQYGISPWIGMLVGAVLAAGVGYLIGKPTLKMRGAYFALSTMAFVEGIRVMVENIDMLGPLKLNGPRGLNIPPLQAGEGSFWAFQFASKEPYYYIILTMLVAVLAMTAAISRSKMGYYLKSGGEDPDAAQALGVNVARYKVTAMAISSFLTALAGTFLAQLTLFIYPKSVLTLDLSFELAFIALIGGRGSIAGPIIGALLLRPVTEFSRIYFSATLPGLHLIILGVVLIVVMLYQPRGLTEPLLRLFDKVAARFAPAPPDDPGTPDAQGGPDGPGAPATHATPAAPTTQGSASPQEERP